MKNHILVITNTIDAGGAETFLMKVFRAVAPEGICFDFLINKKDSEFFRSEIEALRGTIYYGVPKSKAPFKSFSHVYRTVRENGYRCVICVAVHPAGFLDLLAARLGGARICLTRSTIADAGSFLSRTLAAAGRPFIRALSTTMAAPSKEAGAWLFGKKAVESGKVQILHNGIDTEVFRYNQELRTRVRRELHLNAHTLAVGHVGRFSKQKNHTRVLSIFSQVLQLRPDNMLFLAGEGALEEEIRAQVHRAGLEDHVVFLGVRRDIPALLNAFDAFLFPSFYEGMPNSVIEAQATGLPCLISDTISPDVKLTECVKALPLAAEDSEWAHELIALSNIPRRDRTEELREKGYDISQTAEQIISIFSEEQL